MSAGAKEFASQLKQAIEEARKNGTVSIDCNNLISSLDEFIDSTATTITEVELEHYKAQLQVWIETEKREHAAGFEMFRSVIQSGQNAIKSSFLLNGGAAVALLAFISKLTEVQPSKVPCFAEVLMMFVWGALAIVMASGSTYLSQWFGSEQSPSKQKIGFYMNVFSIVLGMFSYGFFIGGMFKAYASFVAFV